MKRYRVSTFSLDTSRNIFRHYDDNKYLDATRKRLEADFVSRFGKWQFEEKLKRNLELEKPTFSVIAEHTHLLEDISNSYIAGNFYSALTGACCLGERIFNDVIFKVLDDFKSSPRYKEIHNKDSIIDWKKAINILSDWKIINKELRENYLRLYKLRTDSVHFQKKEQDAIEMSLEAINIVNFIIERLFGINPNRKDILLYFDVPGEVFLRKSAESDSIAKAFYIPCSVLVGPKFRMESGERLGSFRVIDNHQYEDIEISDEEFVKKRKSFKG